MNVFDAPVIGADELMTMTATIQRDDATRDSLGAIKNHDWQDLADIACFMWWGTGAVATRMGSIQQRAESTIDLDTGGMILPADTDITARDRISQVLNSDGSVYAEGPLEVLAVGQYLGLTEVSLRRVT